MNAASKKIVVVTGAARGIGWGIANRLARAGHQIVILDADGDTLQDRLDQAIKEEMHITGQICDVTDQKNVESCIQSVIGEYGRLDILINNAGLQYVALVEDFPPGRFQLLINVMLTGAFLTTKYAFPYMKNQRWGRIINISSINGLIGFAGKSAYNSAKHGLLGLTKVTALEGAEFGITVNAVCPGYIDTDLVRGQLKDIALTRKIAEERVLEEVIFPLVPQKRLIAIEEVAELVWYLTGDLAGGITGQTLVIDGGYTVQ